MEEADRQAAMYQISIYGELDVSWADWIGVTSLTHETQDNGASITTLTGTVPDQAALRGLIERIWDLNLTLLSVRRIGPTIGQPGGKHK